MAARQKISTTMAETATSSCSVTMLSSDFSAEAVATGRTVTDVKLVKSLTLGKSVIRGIRHTFATIFIAP